MKTIEFNNKEYPYHQATGFAARFAFPFANEMIGGCGVDIGCAKQEWAFPGALPVDIVFEDEWHAKNLPTNLDYIFSSHCLEHLEDWVGILNYWFDCLAPGGVMFLYLPHYSQEYWRPWNNRKHVNVLSPKLLKDYFKSTGRKNIFVTKGYDLNNSFYAVATK